MQLTENEIDYFRKEILQEIKPNLIGARLVYKANPLPVGERSVTRTRVKNLRGKARIGRGTDDTREAEDTERFTIPLVAHSHGFKS